ncbi:hypothetical protein LSUE1_G009062, partial [Lachnellula suecica]
MAFRDVEIEERVPFLEANASPRLETITIEDKGLAPVSRQERLVRILGFVAWRWNTILQFRPRSPKQVRSSALKFASFFIPSFLRSGPASPREVHETAYLDGLRGYASYAVFLSHHVSAYCNEGWHPFGEGQNNHNVKTDYFFQRPIIRIVYNGQAAITIFFVLSGYVLSYKPLKLIHAREFEKLQGALSSMIFRRWFRLFLPVAALWVINVFLVEFGAFSWFDAYKVDHPGMPPGMIEEYLARGDSFWGTAYNAYESFWDFTRNTWWIWSTSGKIPQVDGHTWTLHVEFRSSCILYLFLHGTSKMQANLRLAFYMLSSTVCLFWGEWAFGTFLAGSAIADLDLRMRRRKALATNERPEQSLGFVQTLRTTTSLSSLQDRALSFLDTHGDQLLWASVFVWSLLFLSYPTVGADKVAFYSLLSYWHPYTAWDLFFWLSVGGIVIVFVSGRLRILQRALETPFSQYIGKTSFALYLVHGTVI